MVAAGPAADVASASFYALDPDAILDAVEALGLRPSGHLLALASYENRVYQIGLEDAPPVVAKFYRPGRWDDAAILEEHDYTLELAAAELPVVAPIQDAQGRTLHRHAEYRYALYPRVGGRAPDLDDLAQLEELGRLVGRLHAIGALRPYRHRPAIDPVRLGEEPVRYLAQGELVPADVRAAYAAVAGALVERVRDTWAAVAPHARLRLHGDCHGGNLLAREGVIRLVDFDDSGNGPAMQDLWLFLSGDRAYMEAGLTALLRGYTIFRDFDPSELALIEPLRALRMLHYAAWLARRREDPAFALAFPWFGTPRYWGDHVLALREQLAALDEPAPAWI